MEILVTGATGVVGTELVRTLAARGDRVRAISRDPAAAREKLPQLAAAYFADDAAAYEGLDGVVNLAGETVAGRWTSSKKRAIEESRVEGTRRLVERLRAAARPPSVLVSASAIGFYGDTGERQVTEEDRAGDDFLARVCLGWEREAQRAGEGMRVVRVRIGLVMAKEGGALKEMLPIFKLGAGGPLGSGQQWWPWIDREDLVGLILFALDDARVVGALNGVAPNALRQIDFARALGRALHRPAFVPAPAFAIRAALGEFSAELLTSRRVLPAKAQELGYRFAQTDLDSCLRHVLGQ
jgi:uncharacterized protein